MVDGYTALAFGLCAAINLHGAQDMVEFGYIAHNRCVVQLEVGDPIATTIIGGHDVAVIMLEDGAEIAIDNLRFTIQKTDPV